MPKIELLQGDITQQSVDAIVNAITAMPRIIVSLNLPFHSALRAACSNDITR